MVRNWNNTVLSVAAMIALGGSCLFHAGCRKAHDNAVNVVGSTSIQPFAEMLSQEFNERAPGMKIEVQGGGSTAGLMAVKDGLAEIGMCSRELKPDEKPQYAFTIIALDGLAMVVHPSNPVAGLSKAQIREIFSGVKTNWKDFGGADRVVHVITREEGSGTREAFQKLIMGKDRIYRKAVTQESNGAVKELVKGDPAAIGFMSLGLVREGELKTIKVDGVMPTAQTVKAAQINKTTATKSMEYPLVRPFLFVYHPDGLQTQAAKEFLQFVLSGSGQAMMEKEGLVGIHQNGVTR